jgi:large subunit ribosomal protein L4
MSEIMKCPRFNMDGEQNGDVNLPVAVFGIKPHEHSLYEYVKMFLANQRQGNASTKTVAEVHGSGIKPWRQKGRGVARAGSRRSPLWRGGGVTFGPKPRSYYYRIPKKVVRLALKSAFSTRASENGICVLEEPKYDKPQTNRVVNLIKNLDLTSNRILFLTPYPDQNFLMSTRNIPNVSVMEVRNANAYVIMRHHKLVITEGALAYLEGLE